MCICCCESGFDIGRKCKRFEVGDSKGACYCLEEKTECVEGSLDEVSDSSEDSSWRKCGLGAPRMREGVLDCVPLNR